MNEHHRPAARGAAPRDDIACHCNGPFGPNPECGACGGSGCITAEIALPRRPVGPPLTGAHVAMLAWLAAHPRCGALTGHLAEITFGEGSSASRATGRMRTLAKRGLVRRHETNRERWFITEVGRDALAALEAIHPRDAPTLEAATADLEA